MTTAVENQPPQVPADDDDVYHSDDVGLRDTPPLRPMKVNLEPSPSPPPAVPLPQVSPDSSPGPPNRKGSNRPKNRPSQGDAVLVSFMDGGKRPDIARQAGHEPLASDDEEDEGSMKGTKINVDLAAIAGAALANEDQITEDILETAQNESATKGDAPSADAHDGEGDPMEDVKPTIPFITATLVDEPRSRSPPEPTIKSEIKNSPDGELPPIRQQSPKSGLSNGTGSGTITLPSLSAQLGDLSHLGEAAPPPNSTFSQSPPVKPLPRFPAIGHGSPPKSPNDVFRRELPSPGRGPGHFPYYNTNSHPRRPSEAGTPYTSGGDYSSSNTETPSTDQSGSTPAMAIDRMSIDGITNPQIGGFQCNYPGCNAQPFQTQYLLNSHANVHSSNRPHYCGVKGCPRSEGGKGFKRKNEMIRHGLVHDSPGYVCPFCPDREHKYPRPDNLQRHVRVHHVDKDKDDAQLREVLSQRPEGPSRGRRRRGGTS